MPKWLDEKGPLRRSVDQWMEPVLLDEPQVWNVSIIYLEAVAAVHQHVTMKLLPSTNIVAALLNCLTFFTVVIPIMLKTFTTIKMKKLIKIVCFIPNSIDAIKLPSVEKYNYIFSLFFLLILQVQNMTLF